MVANLIYGLIALFLIIFLLLGKKKSMGDVAWKIIAIAGFISFSLIWGGIFWW